ncbi:hypothetical protein IMX26_07810 [Clostridium sp. 'deep sea']|uniref:hypothetical protein n=1 Tax=Clostridium sp. 'deep sea' TaxID=2779445 RepID=UPI00189658A4|nr:hypothetical protein [Clostridium sp. 'deep sea']QOR36702.1 hypothetical protein IMX26_07810 [Clostridium sp. 'deep sea']
MSKFCTLLKEAKKQQYESYKKYCKIAGSAPNEKVKKKMLTYAKNEYDCYLALKCLAKKHCQV